jgi:integrase/recombinase XerD
MIKINGLLQASFKNWMNSLGYAQSSIDTSINFIKDFFFYLKNKEIQHLEQVNRKIIIEYHRYLQTRKKKKSNGCLSDNYIIGNINAIKRFCKYLHETKSLEIDANIKLGKAQSIEKPILTVEEIKQLYACCEDNIMGIRDKLILDLYYGCGLRRSEGIALNTEDILLRERMFYIKKSKNYTQRYVPITESIKINLELYLNYARPKLQNNKINENALLLNYKGSRLSGNYILQRLTHLRQEAGIDKSKSGVHILRHSIASHLLASGMEVEQVGNFLGHRSLESTQIYTRLGVEG